MKKLLYLTIYFFTCIFSNSILSAQQIDFTVRYNADSSHYEVYGKAVTTLTNFNVGGGSQLSLVLPSFYEDIPLEIKSVTGGIWADNSQIYAPSIEPNSDFHSITSDGVFMADFSIGEELLLYTFELSEGNCLEGIRLFDNSTDPKSSETGMMGSDFRNYFADGGTLINYYHGNYDNQGTQCSGPRAEIFDPCNCLANESGFRAGDGQFSESISVKSKPGEVWTIARVTGLYQNPNAPNFPPVSGNSGPYAQIPYAIGTAMTEVAMSATESRYILRGIHQDAIGYQITVTNGRQDLTIGNSCNYETSCGFSLETSPDGTPGNPVANNEVSMLIMPTGTAVFIDTLNSCDAEKNTFVDDGTIDGLYKDSTARNNIITICPATQWQTVMVTFTDFDLEQGDLLNVYEGTATNAADRIAVMQGTGVSNANGGWVMANCDPDINPKGCLTFQLITDGDNRKGRGWAANVTCSERDIELEQPNNLNVKLNCEETYAIMDIVPAVVEAGCGAVQDSQIVRVFNSLGAICLDTCLASTDVVQDTFGVGAYLVEYKLKSDTTKTTSGVLSVQGATLVCNDEVTVPLGSACAIVLTPDDLLEGTCDTITDTIYQYITLKYTDKNGKNQVVSGGGKGGNYPLLTKEMIGQCGGQIIAEIEKRYYEGLDLSFCNNGAYSESCTVLVNLVDQSGPVFYSLSQVDTFKLCTTDLSPENLGIPTPQAIDNCEEVTVQFAGMTVLNTGGACDTTRANITWTATDACGNSTSANQLVVILRPDAADVVKAGDIVLSCGEDEESAINDFAKTGLPSLKIGKVVNGVLEPTDTIALDTLNYTCGYILQKRDIQVPADCGIKVFRYWSILDWCDSNEGIIPLDTQFIELRDTLAPTFLETELVTATIDLPHNACATNLDSLARPVATDNCGVPSVRLDAVFRIEDGELWPVGTTNLDCDSFQVRWVATDACHTQLVNDTLNQIVLIEDNTKPSAICTDKINFSLAQNTGTLHYKEIDRGSYDACGIRSYEVSRDEINWDSVVTLTCEDAHQEVPVYLRVTDKKGNQNTCWMVVKVEDKIAPICSDLPDMVGNCDGAHISDLGTITDTNGNGQMEETEWVEMTEEQIELFNQAYGNPNCSDNIDCGGLVIEQQYQLIQKGCGIINIKRRFRAIDWDGEGRATNWYEQNINIESKADWSITLPADWGGSCGDSVPTSELIIENGTCDLLTYDVNDKVFAAQDGNCLKVVRTFTIINWCTYQAGTPATQISRPEDEHGFVLSSQTLTTVDFEKVGRLEYIQILKLTDEEAPIIEPIAVEECLSGTACADTKQFAITATDCHNIAPTALQYQWAINDENGELANGQGAIFEYPVSANEQYQVTWIVADNCGNSSKETIDYQFKDCKKPSPYCLHGIAVDLMENIGTIQVWASDVERGSSDNCSPTDKLQYRIWHADLATMPTTTEEVLALPEVLTFNCTHLGNQEVYLYAIDIDGNWDFCTTYVNVQDNTNACEGITPPNEGMALVSGNIMDWQQRAVEGVQVQTMKTGEMVSEMATPENGQYHFNLEMYENYSIAPNKNDLPLNGVSTFDLVLITKHILGQKLFKNPYQMIAADANKSGTITAFDMVQVRKLILAIDQSFPNNTSWRFVAANYEFTTVTPLTEDFPESVQVVDLEDNMKLDFVAVKVGDVNGSAQPNSLMIAENRTSSEVFDIITEDKVLKAGERYTVMFHTEQLATIQGYQFTLGFEDLEVLKLKSGVVGVENFGMHQIEKGMITTSWNHSAFDSEQYAVNTKENAQLFSIDFTALKDGKLSEQLSLLNRPTAIEAYDEDGNIMEVQLTFTTPLDKDQFQLFQNQPNPFHDKTTIGFHMHGDAEVELVLRDETGRVLKTIKEHRKAGYNTFELNKEELTNGLIFYQLSTKFGTKTKKMLRIK